MWTCWCVDILQMGADMDPCKEKKKKKEREEKKEKGHTAGGGLARVDGPCGSVGVQAWDEHADVWARCRACSTAEHTATNIVIAPIVCTHRAAPCSSCLCSSAPCAPCSLCSLLFTPAPFAPAPCSCSLFLTRAPCSPCSSRSHSLLSLLLALALPVLPAPHAHAPFTRSSLHSQLPFRLWCCSRTFPSIMCAHYYIFRLCFSALSLAPWTIPFLV